MPYRFFMDFELGPGDDLQKLLQGAIPARQGDEGVRTASHLCLPGVHVSHHYGLPDSVASEVWSDQSLGDDTYYMTPGVLHCLCKLTH